MKESKAKKVVQKILDPSDVQINGSRPWDIQIHKPSFYERVLRRFSCSGGKLHGRLVGL